MKNRIKILGVHPVAAAEPVHLIEIEIEGSIDAFDFGEVTQQLDKPRENWQAAYDERELAASSGKARFAFFFHYLDFDRPLQTSFGAVTLPAETRIPAHLSDIQYEEP